MNFQAEQYWVDQTPIYRITAYQDAASRRANSDNYFREVDSPGDYKIAEPLQDFTSYAIFIDRTGDQPKKYLKKNNEF